MNGDTSSNRAPKRGSLRRARVLALVPGIALLTAACSGSPSSAPGSGSSGQFQQDLAFTQCMRSHGLPDFPGPSANGHGFGNQQQQNQERGNPHFGTAYRACQHLLPSGPSPDGNKKVPSQTQLVRFSRCMRSHGVPEYPDYNPSVSLRTELAQLGINTNSPQFQAALRTCDRLVPLGGGS